MDTNFVQGLIEDAEWFSNPVVGDYEGCAHGGWWIDLILHENHVAYRVTHQGQQTYGTLTDREFIQSILLPLEYERRAKQ